MLTIYIPEIPNVHSDSVKQQSIQNSCHGLQRLPYKMPMANCPKNTQPPVVLKRGYPGKQKDHARYHTRLKLFPRFEDKSARRQPILIQHVVGNPIPPTGTLAIIKVDRSWGLKALLKLKGAAVTTLKH